MVHKYIYAHIQTELIRQVPSKHKNARLSTGNWASSNTMQPSFARSDPSGSSQWGLTHFSIESSQPLLKEGGGAERTVRSECLEEHKSYSEGERKEMQNCAATNSSRDLGEMRYYFFPFPKAAPTKSRNVLSFIFPLCCSFRVGKNI